MTPNTKGGTIFFNTIEVHNSYTVYYVFFSEQATSFLFFSLVLSIVFWQIEWKSHEQRISRATQVIISLLHFPCRPPNPLATPLAGVSQVWAGKSHLLRFSHASGMLSLSVCLSESCPSTQTLQSSILLLQECVKDSALLNKVR